MSRNRRGEVFQNRWNQPSLVIRKNTNAGRLAYLNRMIKRMNKAAGHEVNKHPFIWSYSGLGKSGTVYAFTRSEARAKIKKLSGLARLPKGIVIEKGERCQTSAL